MLIPLGVVLLLASCSDNGWSEEDKNEFVEGCEVRSECDCHLERIIKKYPDKTLYDKLDITEKGDLFREVHKACEE